MTSNVKEVTDFLCFNADKPVVDVRPMHRLVTPPYVASVSSEESWAAGVFLDRGRGMGLDPPPSYDLSVIRDFY